MTPMTDSKTPERLNLTKPGHDDIQLKIDLSKDKLPMQLEQAFADMELMHRQNHTKKAADKADNLKSPELASQFLSRFGLKGPEDIKTFLRSPAGETVKEELGHELFIEQKREERQEQMLREKQKRQNRLIALLLLYLAAKSSHAKELRDYITEEVNKHLKEVKKSIKQSNTPSASQSTQPDRNYQQTVYHLEEQLKLNEDELKQVESELEDVENKLAELESKHQARLEDVSQSEDMVLSVLDGRLVNELSPEEKQSAAQKLGELLQQVAVKKPDEDSASIKSLQSDLLDQRESFIDKIDFRKRHIEAMRNVLMGTHKMFDHNFNEVHHPEQAHLIMPEDKIFELRHEQRRVVEHDQQFYLLKKGEKIEDLSPEQRQHAKDNYRLQLNPQKYLSPRHLCQAHFAEQCAVHHEKLNDLKSKQFHLVNQRVELHNQLSRLQAFRANMQMNPNLKPSSSSAKFSAQNITSSYRSVMDDIRSNPTVDDLAQLETSYKGTPAAKNVSKLRPGQPIPKETFKQMMCTQLPDETVKQTLNKLAQLHPDSVTQKLRNQNPENPSPDSNLTPFKTKPDIYGK